MYFSAHDMEVHYNLDRCREALLKKPLEQKDLAEDGLSESAISKFFRGKPVRPKTAARIIKKLGLKLDDVRTLKNGTVTHGRKNGK